MLNRIINVIKSSKIEINDGTLLCNNYVITDLECLDFLEDENLLEEPLTSKIFGDTINLEISLAHVNSVGFFEDFSSFIKRNKYTETSAEYYLYDLGIYKSSGNKLLQNYRTILHLSVALQSISSHNFDELDIKCGIISKEEKSIVLPLIYNNSSIERIESNIERVQTTIDIFENNTYIDKRILFINELISFLAPLKEEERYSYLLLNFGDYYEKSINAYEFYLRDFSYNKLKIEIDAKSLEFNQKIQAVINDSQTKLIAIPTAFVLVFSTFDFGNSLSMKNIATLGGTFIFAIIIQLFLSNQFSVLKFIRNNIGSYKETFRKSNINLFEEKFTLNYAELNKQKIRLNIVEILLWLVPILLLIIWLLSIFDCKSYSKSDYLTML